MTLKEMLTQKQTILNRIQEIEDSLKPQTDPLRQQLNALESQINTKAFESLKSAMTDKDTGTVNFTCEEVLIKATVTKTVKWDQKKLATIYTKIRESGDNPDQYIKPEYSVSENAYKNWPEAIQKVFLPARTVIPGKPKFQFHINEDSIPPWEERAV